MRRVRRRSVDGPCPSRHDGIGAEGPIFQATRAARRRAHIVHRISSAAHPRAHGWGSASTRRCSRACCSTTRARGSAREDRRRLRHEDRRPPPDLGHLAHPGRWVCHWGGNPAWATLAAGRRRARRAGQGRGAAAVAAQGSAMYGSWADKLRPGGSGPVPREVHARRLGGVRRAVHVGMHRCARRGGADRSAEPRDGSVPRSTTRARPLRGRGRAVQALREPDRPCAAGADAVSTPTKCALAAATAAAAAEVLQAAGGTRVRGGPSPACVLDFGFAVAGPWTSQFLADRCRRDLGRRARYHAAWPLNHMGMASTRASATSPSTSRTRRRPMRCGAWIESADVITHNMRPERRSVSASSTRRRAINPA
jgi:hypothetical protein